MKKVKWATVEERNHLIVGMRMKFVPLKTIAERCGITLAEVKAALTAVGLETK
jgi:hypothetical protein